MKKEFLVVYDYGQGGTWAFIRARSRADIERRFPDLDLIDEAPEWMTKEQVARLKERMTFDADEPSGWLAQLASRPDHGERDATAG